MGTFAFREIVCSVLRQSRFRLVHEFNWGFRSSVRCKISKCNFKEQLPGIRFSLTPKWCSSVLICPCQISTVLTMPKCKLEDKSNSKHKGKKVSSNAHVKSSSLKQIKKKKKKKHHRSHHHKRKHSVRHSSKEKARTPQLILLDSSSGNDSDVQILYDSRMKNKKHKHISAASHCVKNDKINKSEGCETSQNTIQAEVEISDGNKRNGPMESNKKRVLHKGFEQHQSVIDTAERECISKKNQDFDYNSASILLGDGPLSTLRSDQVISGPSSGTPLDGQPSDKTFIKKWEFTNFGKTMENKTKDASCNERSHLTFNVLSYNVLCQEIMEEHMDLYTQNNPTALDWDYRSKLLMKEFVAFDADIMCLQEVQESHLKSFYSELNKMGYAGLFKQRTGDKKDGVAIYFKKSTFHLIDYTSVEYYQPGVSVLNRDNVGLIVKLAPKLKPDERVIVATTHLLYNPRRHDVKLAQVQILLAEVERFAFKEIDESTKTTKYWPVILTGDMNFEPHTGGFQLLNMGWFRYDGLSNRTLTTEYYGYGQLLGKELLPPYLGVTDTCQHWNIMKQRNLQSTVDLVMKARDDHKSQIKLLQIYNSDFKKLTIPLSKNLESVENDVCEKINTSQKKFGSGKLSHALHLSSVYQHNAEECSPGSQVSTYQNGWVVVDYIFYSYDWNSNINTKEEGNLKLVARYKLLAAEQAAAIGPIPNLSSPSDHYPLAAKFALLF